MPPRSQTRRRQPLKARLRQRTSGGAKIRYPADSTNDNLGATLRDVWTGVELRHLAALAAIDRSGSFRGAAESLGYVQSAVSQQIAFLERLVGTRLVHRSPGPSPVTLTEAGAVLLHHADAILAQLRAARADLMTMTDDGASTLHLGIAQGAGNQLLARVIREFKRSSRAVRVIPRQAATDELLLGFVERGEIDVAMLELPLDSEQLAVVEVVEDPYVLLVHASSELAVLEHPPSAADLAGVQLIVPNASARLLGRLRVAGLALDPLSSTVSDTTAQSLVSGGMGPALLPRLAVDALTEDVRLLAVGELLAPRRVGLCWHAGRHVSETIARFADAAVAAFEGPGRRSRQPLPGDVAVG